jgi:hypothetical protein
MGHEPGDRIPVEHDALAQDAASLAIARQIAPGPLRCPAVPDHHPNTARRGYERATALR